MNNNILYSSKNITALENNIDKIYDNSVKATYDILEPKQLEYFQVKDIIRTFIKNNKRVVYGGTAYYEIIKNNKKIENIYKPWERYDIEFYSPTPIKDMINLCNILYKEKFNYVVGRQSQHHETYTIFVNFVQYCDITYMPKIIYDNIDHILIDDIAYIHPNLILIDIFRIYTDPLTSYWRLNKVVKRMKLLLSSYKYDFSKTSSLIYTNKQFKLINYIIDNIPIDKYIMTGQMAYLLYTSTKQQIDVSLLDQLEIITDNVDNLVIKIKELILQFLYNNDKFINFDKYFTIKYYSKFFQYWDKRVIIYFDTTRHYSQLTNLYPSKHNAPIVTIIGSNNRCLPYIKYTLYNRIFNISSYILTFNYFLIGFYYEKIHNLGFYFKDKDIINSLLTSRNFYLKKKKKTILDNTIYKEFIIDCIGETTDFTREYFLRISKNKIKGIQSIINYDPSKRTHIEESYDQADGLEIKN